MAGRLWHNRFIQRRTLAAVAVVAACVAHMYINVRIMALICMHISANEFATNHFHVILFYFIAFYFI